MNPDLTLREFKGTKDLARLKSFLTGRIEWQSLPDYWTAGKSTVGMFQTIFDSPAEHHKFWCDEKGVDHAYLWLHPEPSATIEGAGNSWRVLVHPQLRTTALVEELIVFAEDQLPELARPEAVSKTIETAAYGKDAWLAALLEDQGYVRQEALDVYMRRRLDTEIEAPMTVNGYTIRPLQGERDLVQRAGVQSDAFAGDPQPGEWAITNTRRFLTWYQGREDLDLVAVAANGEIAAFAVFLVDQGTLVGELDPVGTRAAHQRKGLSKAILRTGLDYLKSKGMRQAVVRTSVGNTPAIRAYESVGFDVVDHLYRYTKSAG